MDKFDINSREFPRPIFLFRLIRAFPFMTIFCRSLVLRSMKNCRNVDFKSGFFVVRNNNIFAKNCNLNDTVFINYSPVYVGSNTSFFGKCTVITSFHDFLNFSSVLSDKIFIGANCQIGHGAIILHGVNLGDNVVVGAGSVVTKSFSAGSVIAGNPARLIRNIYD